MSGITPPTAPVFKARRKKYIYVSSALTGLAPEVRERTLSLLERIDAMCRRAFYIRLPCYLPHRYSDPVLNHAMTPREVYLLDELRVRQARLMIVVSLQPSDGVGGEMVIADVKKIPVILCIPPDRGTVSRFTLGNPALGPKGSERIIRYRDEKHLLDELKRMIMALLGRKNQRAPRKKR